MKAKVLARFLCFKNKLIELINLIQLIKLNLWQQNSIEASRT